MSRVYSHISTRGLTQAGHLNCSHRLDHSGPELWISNNIIIYIHVYCYLARQGNIWTETNFASGQIPSKRLKKAQEHK